MQSKLTNAACVPFFLYTIFCNFISKDSGRTIVNPANNDEDDDDEEGEAADMEGTGSIFFN